MKKAALIFSIIGLLGSVFLSSCKMREKCPAYGAYGKVSINIAPEKPC